MEKENKQQEKQRVSFVQQIMNRPSIDDVLNQFF